MNNFNEGMISVQPPFLSCGEREGWQGWNIDFSPAVYRNFLPFEHLTSLLHLYIAAPEEKRRKKGEASRNDTQREDARGKEREDDKNP